MVISSSLVRKHNTGRFPDIDMGSKGGFIYAGLNYTVQLPFGNIGAAAGLFTNFFDGPSGGVLNAKNVSISYGYRF